MVGEVEKSGMEPCALCSNTFSRGDMVRLEGKLVCPSCKPQMVQMLQEGVSTADITVGRRDRSLIMGRNARLPDRCVKCNAPAVKRLKRKLFWHKPAWYLLILINLFIYAIVAMIVGKRAVIEVGLCEEHSSRRRKAIAVTWGLVLAGVALFFGAAFYESGPVVFLGVLLLLAAAIYGSIAVPVSRTQRIDKEFVWLKGVNEEFLDSLPEWRGPWGDQR